MWKSSQKWSVRRSAVRSSAWLGLGVHLTSISCIIPTSSCLSLVLATAFRSATRSGPGEFLSQPDHARNVVIIECATERLEGCLVVSFPLDQRCTSAAV
jgi:hypothetical protein